MLKLQETSYIKMNDFNELRQRIMRRRSFGKPTGNYARSKKPFVNTTNESPKCYVSKAA